MDKIEGAMALIAYAKQLAECELDGDLTRRQALHRMYAAAREREIDIDWGWADVFYTNAFDRVKDDRSTKALLEAALKRPISDSNVSQA